MCGLRTWKSEKGTKGQKKLKKVSVGLERIATQVKDGLEDNKDKVTRNYSLQPDLQEVPGNGESVLEVNELEFDRRRQ